MKSARKIGKLGSISVAIFSLIFCIFLNAAISDAAAAKWMTGDFHQHTLYTDGTTTFDFVMDKNDLYDLDWWANSEHGGARLTDGNGHYWDDTQYHPAGTILGDVKFSNGHQYMWRWQSLRDFVFPDILDARSLYLDRRIASGVEWNVPGHEHCSVGIIADDASAVSAFDYMFDNGDDDFSREGEFTPYGTLTKTNGKSYTRVNATTSTNVSKSFTDRHADAVAAAKWMQDQYDTGLIDNAWMIFAHIERQGPWSSSAGGGYNIEHFRDLNNAAPDICLGFEGVPGHQAAVPDRGEFSPGRAFGGTYGGAGFYTAKVGGLWDALLGEGRHWFNFANGDYHTHYTVNGADFYPGEYQKNHTYVTGKSARNHFSLNDIANGLRSGNSYLVMGDLVDYLDFSAASERGKTPMGGTLHAKKGKELKIVIKFKSPTVNHRGDKPAVDHVDLIAGNITGKVDPSDTPNYTKATNESTRVIARFTPADWKKDKHGYVTMVYNLKPGKSMYFRLRGTNLAPSTPFETDADGNPLADSLATANLGLDGAEEAWADLWFYSNPIFVYVK